MVSGQGSCKGCLQLAAIVQSFVVTGILQVGGQIGHPPFCKELVPSVLTFEMFRWWRSFFPLTQTCHVWFPSWAFFGVAWSRSVRPALKTPGSTWKRSEVVRIASIWSDFMRVALICTCFNLFFSGFRSCTHWTSKWVKDPSATCTRQGVTGPDGSRLATQLITGSQARASNVSRVQPSERWVCPRVEVPKDWD